VYVFENIYLCYCVFTKNIFYELQNATEMIPTEPSHTESKVFMQTVACQAISGIFTWAAILDSCHHVSAHT